MRSTVSCFHTCPSHQSVPDSHTTKSFRLPRPQRLGEGESAINKAGNYFLLTEMFRGMYVVLEQLFRPP